MKRRPRQQRAFTLIELLVVVGITGLLIGILLPALHKARVASQELRSLSGLRQMMLGYTMYYQENKGAVLFGYTPMTVNGVTITVTDPVSGQSFGDPIADRYPWRLVSYVDNIWQIIHSHGEMPPLTYAGENATQAFSDAYTLSLNPTYGINSVFVGGDANSEGFGYKDASGFHSTDQPNTGQFIVFRANQVRSTSSLIVFADCQTWNVPSLAGTGLYSLTPPFTSTHNWQVTDDQVQILNPNAIMGGPQGWYSNRIMVAFFDGHVESMLPGQIDDMRLWANWADSPTYQYTP